MQFAPDTGLLSSGRLFARALSVAGHQRNLRSREDQGRILQPAKHQSQRHRAAWTRVNSPRTAAQPRTSGFNLATTKNRLLFLRIWTEENCSSIIYGPTRHQCQSCKPSRAERV